MHPAILYQKSDDKKVTCQLCPFNCTIAPDKAGVCKIRKNIDGELFALGYGQLASIAADPIEKKPLFNFYPGSLVMSIGGLGCNFRCKHCQNWSISQIDAPGSTSHTDYISPEDLIKIAKRNNCKGIASTYNEPTINIEYAIDAFKLAKENNLYTVFVTNGYISEAGLDAIGPYLDAYAVDIKGFKNKFYKEVAGVPDVQPVLDACLRAKNKWNMHIEATTNIVPTYNDGEEELRKIANWIKDNLGPDTPWHVSRFWPAYQLKNVPPTSTETIHNARKIGLEAGLHYVYAGNIPGDIGENSYCPNCKKIIVERIGYQIVDIKIKDSKCTNCEEEVAIIQ